MSAVRDQELEQYRTLVDPPDSFAEGFTVRTALGILFIAVVMMPSSIYMGLIAGQSLGAAAEWVTIILFAELARRSFKPLSKQELYILYYVGGSLVAMVGGGALAGGPFANLIWDQYLVQSPAAQSLGIADQIPRWVVPAADSDALRDRTFWHADWKMAITLLIVGGVLSRVSWITMGYGLFRLTSDVERLPFPMAPIAAEGATALSESGTDTWRWRIFSIGAMIGLTFGAIYVFLPAFTNAIFGKAVHIIPIPWIDLTKNTEAFLPAAPTGISTNLGLVIVGMVLPFSVVVGRFAAAMVYVFVNPVLYHYEILISWRQGMDTITTEFSNSIDFWLSFTIGTAFAIALAGVYSVIRAVQGYRARKSEQNASETEGAVANRGDFSVTLAMSLFILCTLGYVGLCTWLVGSDWHLVLFYFFFGFVFTPVISYINARLIGMAGQHVGFPMVREATFILSGYQGTAIWFAPFPIRDYGGTAQQFREVELTGTRLTSLIKAEIFMFPVVMVASFLFWSYIWGSGDPIPSDAYPYAQKMWHRRALYQSLWISSTVTGQSPLFQAIDLNVILGGLGFGLGSFAVLSLFKLPTMLLYGFISGLGDLPHALIPEMIGALIGRYYFERRFGWRDWRRRTPVLAAGFACGMGLIGMTGVAIALLRSTVATTPW
ncbi:MAG TPA: peptide transporter [Candidatus Latescibacteria bacterium]|jgi:hypothetical protein|nr:peptide transporter [Candidatus Latescibacterota bacterium]HJP33893.1 peptide transporter [Candidatus Latescibacterota bacterium]